MKKNLIPFMVLLLFSSGVWGQGGVNFEELTFEQALKKAKEQGKMLFVDCYTAWCGPCKMMTAKVFTQENVGAYFNEKFVCVKYDMEKGEGLTLAKQFGVKSYPTFLIIHPDGKLRHKLLGASPGKEFIARVEEAFDDRKAFGVMEFKFKDGNRDKVFLTEYVQLLNACMDPNTQKIADELVKVLNDQERLLPEYWYIFERPYLSPGGSAAEQFLLTHREEFNQAYGKEKVDRRLYLGYWNKFMDIFGGREKNECMEVLDRMSHDVTGLRLDTEYIVQAYISLAKSMAGDDIDGLLSTCEKVFVTLQKGQIPRNLFKIYDSQATELQKARWEKLMTLVEAKK